MIISENVPSMLSTDCWTAKSVASLRSGCRRGKGKGSGSGSASSGAASCGLAALMALRCAVRWGAGARGRGCGRGGRSPRAPHASRHEPAAARRRTTDDGRRLPRLSIAGLTRLRASHVQHQKCEVHHEKEPRTEQIHANGHRIASRIVGKTRVQ
ncbi:hypothetical protein RR46_15293 [Papilio xuthus]|uniref:Uncharacterized protein n=1 Tax=Papilio xuthus TaxID=66420 RepID=A0A194PGF7_PAPXU|nr:hypothetical protein RR46_15293 [Papilio xuthus]